MLSFLKSSVLFRDSVKDLDAALAEMISDPSFPQVVNSNLVLKLINLEASL